LKKNVYHSFLQADYFFTTLNRKNVWCNFQNKIMLPLFNHTLDLPWNLKDPIQTQHASEVEHIDLHRVE